jgi:hypothetical protein
MEQPTDMFSMYLKFIPVILAVIFWIYCLSSKYSLSRMETMRQLKRWYDLPRASATENKEETLNNMIAGTEKSSIIQL